MRKPWKKIRFTRRFPFISRTGPAASPNPPNPLLLPTCTYWAGVDSDSASQCVTWLRGLAQTKLKRGRRHQVTLNINSRGGDLHDSVAIHDSLRLYAPWVEVFIIATGRCMSGGVTILMGVPIDHRYGTAGTEFMIHPATMNGETRLQAELGGPGVPVDLSLDHFRGHRLQELGVIEKIATGTGMTADEVRALLGPNDTFFDAQRAKELGFIGHIL